MCSNKAEPGDSPRQPQFIDKGSVRAEPFPARTATEPRRSSRIKTRPQAPLTGRDKRARSRTINKQVIGCKLKNTKHASRKKIALLIKTQLKLDEATPPLTKTHNKTTHEQRNARAEPIFTYNIPCPKSKRSPAPVTQEETEL